MPLCNGITAKQPLGLFLDCVIASEAKQSNPVAKRSVDCFVAALLAMTKHNLSGP
jgi:hypothetical protein